MPLANPKLDNSHPFRSANQINASSSLPLNGLEAVSEAKYFNNF